MKVLFKTNIDNYSTKRCFPENFEIPPRIGESVRVKESFVSYYETRKLPTVLKVVDVIWTEEYVLCELDYSKFDLQAAKLSNVNLY